MKVIGTKWIAEAFLFSGRRNPQWQLNMKQNAEWMKLWQAASPSGKNVKMPSILGYTGCRLKMNEHSHWFIYDGCVSFYEKGNVINKKDTDRQMEFFLMRTAPEDVKKILNELKIF